MGKIFTVFGASVLKKPRASCRQTYLTEFGFVGVRSPRLCTERMPRVNVNISALLRKRVLLFLKVPRRAQFTDKLSLLVGWIKFQWKINKWKCISYKLLGRVGQFTKTDRADRGHRRGKAFQGHRFCSADSGSPLTSLTVWTSANDCFEPWVRQWEIICQKMLNAEIVPQNNIVLEHWSAELISV